MNLRGAIPVASTSCSISRFVTWMRSISSCRARRVSGTRRTRGSPTFPAGRGSTEPEPGAVRSKSCWSGVNWLGWKIDWFAAPAPTPGGPTASPSASRAVRHVAAASYESAHSAASCSTKRRECAGQSRVRRPTAARRNGLPTGAARRRAAVRPLTGVACVTARRAIVSGHGSRGQRVGRSRARLASRERGDRPRDGAGRGRRASSRQGPRREPIRIAGRRRARPRRGRRVRRLRAALARRRRAARPSRRGAVPDRRVVARRGRGPDAPRGRIRVRPAAPARARRDPPARRERRRGLRLVQGGERAASSR